MSSSFGSPLSFLKRTLSQLKLGHARPEAPPPREPRDFLQIRLEAIGGQGANSAGKVLAEAGVLGHGMTGNHFSSFGSEKRGSPVQSFVRLAPDGRAVRSTSPIDHPDLLAVFHAHLGEVHQTVFAGSTPETDLLINSQGDPEDLHLPADLAARSLSFLDASSIARRLGCGLNAPMLGALARLTPELSLEQVIEAAARYFGGRVSKKGVGVADANRKGIEEGYQSVVTIGFQGVIHPLAPPTSSAPRLGWRNAPQGGVILNGGNTIFKDNSASRTGLAPLFDPELCIHCGNCDMVCPDYCFSWTLSQGSARLVGLDFQYCKGCLKCVEVCPSQALVTEVESELNPRKGVKLHGT